ncbi:MAG: ankyrin repeat domain-containing protein, partial [Pyrinomonadaceae bacterium]
MSKNEFIKQIEVKNPCSEDWDEMTGNEQIRFCSHCSFEVNNLSAMTRKQALKIVRESSGRICVRYIQNPVNKAPVFADKLYQITRRAGIAAGVLGASLSFSNLTYAQGDVKLVRVTNTDTEISKIEKTDEDKTESLTSSISGTITDSQGNFASGVNVTLINLKTAESQNADTDADGFYEFKNVSKGFYKLSVVNEKGDAEIQSFEILEASENRHDLALNLPTVAEVTVELPQSEAQYEVMGGMALTISYENPLSLAVSRGNLEQVNDLISKGAKVNGKENSAQGITPLFLAVENGNTEITEMLLNFGAKINARDDEKQTPLMRLDDDAAPELVRLLMKHGAKINLTDKAGETALIHATEYAS